jgi:hypothetical protein
MADSEQQDIIVAFVTDNVNDDVDSLEDWCKAINVDVKRTVFIEAKDAIAELPQYPTVRVIVVAGGPAYKALTGAEVAVMARVRGSWTNWREVPVLTVYHPSYVRRMNQYAELTALDLTGLAEYIRRDTRRPRPPFRTSSIAPQGPQVGPLHSEQYRQAQLRNRGG